MTPGICGCQWISLISDWPWCRNRSCGGRSFSPSTRAPTSLDSTDRSHWLTTSSAPEAANTLESAGLHSTEVMGALCCLKFATGRPVCKVEYFSGYTESHKCCHFTPHLKLLIKSTFLLFSLTFMSSPRMIYFYCLLLNLLQVSAVLYCRPRRAICLTVHLLFAALRSQTWASSAAILKMQIKRPVNVSLAFTQFDLFPSFHCGHWPRGNSPSWR